MHQPSKTRIWETERKFHWPIGRWVRYMMLILHNIGTRFEDFLSAMELVQIIVQLIQQPDNDSICAC